MTTGSASKIWSITIWLLVNCSFLYAQNIQTECFEEFQGSEYEIKRLLNNRVICSKINLSHITVNDYRRFIPPDEISLCMAIQNAGIDVPIEEKAVYRRDVYRAKDRIFLVYTMKDFDKPAEVQSDGSLLIVTYPTIITILDEQLNVLERFRFH